MSHVPPDGHQPLELNQRILRIFRESFDRPTLEIQDTHSARDISGWDSLMQVNLIVAVEEEFGLRFSSKEIAGFESIGDMKRTIIAKRVA